MGSSRPRSATRERSRTPARRQKGHWPMLALLLLLTAAVYGPTLDHQFQYDDKWKLLHNPRLEDPRQLFAAFAAEGYNEEAARLLPSLTFCLDHALHGWEPFGFHLTNLVIHLLNVVLVFIFGRQVRQRLGHRHSPVPLLGAALFALHPLNSEAVSYCNARPNLMVVTFYLPTLVLFLRAMESSGQPRSVRLHRWAVCAATGLCALLCKELAITVVVMAPLLFWWLAEDDGKRLPSVVKDLARWIAVLAMIGLGLAVLAGVFVEVDTIVFQEGGDLTGSWVLTLLLTVLGQAGALLRYLGLALLPLPRWLNVDHAVVPLPEQLYGRTGATAGSSLQVLAVPVICAVVILLVLVGAVVARRRARFASFFGLWPFLCHAPNSLIPRGEVMVEYRTYLPMVGVCLLLAWAVDRGLTRLTGRLTLPRPALARGVVCTVLLGALAGGTLVRSRVWQTELSLWQDAAAKRPDNPRAHNNLGVAFVLRDDHDRAMECYRTALQLRPDFADAHNNLANLLAVSGDVDQAIVHFRRALLYDPELAGAHNNLGNALASQGRIEEAAGCYRRALQITPHLADAHSNLASILVRQGKLEESITHYRIALQAIPGRAEAHNNLGYALALAGKLDRAKVHFTKALQINPNYAEAHNNLGNTLAISGNHAEAARHYRSALRINPEYADAHHNLGSALLELGELDQGIEHFEQALRIRPDLVKVQQKLARAVEMRDLREQQEMIGDSANSQS